jgi:preprotein translocase subunit SecE
MGLKTYLEESYKELVHKVTWPTWSELQNSALVVMVASLIIALIVLVMDISFKNLMKLIYDIII